MTRWFSMIGFCLALSINASAALLDDCQDRLSNRNIRDNLLTQSAKPWRISDLNGTPLEVSAYLREWKAALVQNLGIASDQLGGRFFRGAFNIEEISNPEETKILLVRTRAGLRGMVLVAFDRDQQVLAYLDPLFPKVMRTGYGHGPDGLVLSAFEDQLDPTGVSGTLFGILVLKIPGAKFNP